MAVPGIWCRRVRVLLRALARYDIYKRRNAWLHGLRSVALSRTPRGKETVESANRKLIRPSFNEFKEQAQALPVTPRKVQKKPVPPDQTNAENFYYVKQMQGKTPMVFVLKDGEALHGTIEWYAKSRIKINRDGDPNLLLYKSNIKYMYKDE